MVIVAEQIKELRKMRDQLIDKQGEYRSYLENREGTTFEDFNFPVFADYQSEMYYRPTLKELEEVNKILHNAEVRIDRNFDMVDIGTSFKISFGGEEPEDMLLVEENPIPRDLNMVSKNSDLGRAVIGKKPGDSITYLVRATGRNVSVSITAINKLRESYEHFIRERNVGSRISKPVKDSLAVLKREDMDEYRRQHMISLSQRELIDDEMARIGSSPVGEDKKRLNRLIRISDPNNIALPPKDDTIGVGSHVVIALKDEKGDVKQLSFEFINEAITSELESEYVEHISPLGNAIYGLRANDTFIVPRKNKASLKGLVVSVENNYLKTKRV